MKNSRIPQLKHLTQDFTQWFPQLRKQSQPWLFAVSGLALTLSIPAVSFAQSVGTLPAPPPLRVPKNAVPPTYIEPTPEISETIPVPTVPTNSKSSSAIREYTFQAPTSPNTSTSPSTTNPITPSVPETSKTSETSLPISQPPDKTPSLYRVEVAYSKASVLSQVQAVEPLAFVRQSEGVIHAGMFQQSQQAQQRVLELERQGVSAKVVPVYENQGRSASSATRRIVRE